MKTQVFDGAASGGKKLCWITVGRREALLLIKSLVSQLESGDSNVNRLESQCVGAFGELSIVVHPEVESVGKQ